MIGINLKKIWLELKDRSPEQQTEFLKDYVTVLEWDPITNFPALFIAGMFILVLIFKYGSDRMALIFSWVMLIIIMYIGYKYYQAYNKLYNKWVKK